MGGKWFMHGLKHCKVIICEALNTPVDYSRLDMQMWYKGDNKTAMLDIQTTHNVKIY